VNAAYEQRPELARQLKDLEHVADHTTHDIMRALNTSFITPFDREDIAVLAARMDDVVDHIEAAADLTPSDLAFFDPLWRDQERSRSSGTFSPVYAGVSKALIVSTCQPEPGLQIVAKWEAGSSGLPTATTGASTLVPEHQPVAHSSSSDDRPGLLAVFAGGPWRPVSRATAANPSSVPGQWARTASSPARRTTLRSTAVTMMASSA
jgi:hypothetical protein